MRSFLSSQKTYLVILLVTIILRLLSEINNPILTSDYSIQIEAAKNFIKTGSFSHTWVNAADLSTIKSSPLTTWPVGISFFAVFFNFFTSNLIYSQICFQCLGVLLFIFGSIKLLKFFKVDLIYINLFLLLYAFNSAPFYYLGPTDLFTASLFLWLVYLALKQSNNSDYNVWQISYIIILTFIAATLRFACIPNIVIIPTYFFVLALLNRNKNFFIKGTIILAGSSLLVMLFYIIFPIDGGRVSFIDTLKSGNLYYSHLKWFDAFPLKSLFFTRVIEFRLPYNALVIFLYRVGLLLFSFLFLAFLLSRFIKKLNIFIFIKEFKQKNISQNALVALMFICTFTVIVGFITLQTLTSSPENNSFGPTWMPKIWTFVYCTRYFIYIMFLIIILFFIAYHQSKKENKLVFKLFNSLYVLFFCWAFLYWLFINYQFYSPTGNGAGSEWINEKTNITIFNKINAIQKTKPNAAIVFTSYKNKMVEGLITSYSAATPTDDYEAIINNNFKNTLPVTLMIEMPINKTSAEQKFLNEHKHLVLNSFKNEQLITINL